MEKVQYKDCVCQYIAENMHKTIKRNYPELKPVVSPCINKLFTTFYYWDTYFANLAFLELGDWEQVENNLDNMKYMVETMGYIPNEYAPDRPGGGMNRSQPPLFSRGVRDYYNYRQELEIVKKYLPAMEKEYEFWQTQRMSVCGLNRYGHNATKEYLENFYEVICRRLQIEPDSYSDIYEQSGHFLAIAESGWDFTPRFYEPENPYAGMHYAPVDLNAILYDVENILADMCSLLGFDEKAGLYREYAERRKVCMNTYMLGEDGLYYDYNFVTQKQSPVLSAASCLPFMVGVSEDKRALERTVDLLEGEYGLSACVKVPWESYDQWDYPSVWPPLSYFVYEALKWQHSDRAVPFARKYLKTVGDTFRETGHLWEKYDAVKGGVSIVKKEGTVEMLGWTAGVYMYLKREAE